MFGNVLWAVLGHWRLKSILNATEIDMWDSHTQQSWAAGSRFLTGNRFEEIHDNQICNNKELGIKSCRARIISSGSLKVGFSMLTLRCKKN